MKKSLIALVVIMMLASSSFAGVSFLTATSVGEGKVALLGMYATNHNGDVAGGSDMEMSGNDTNSLGLRVEYGLIKDLDLVAAYSSDSYPLMKSAMDATASEGSTTGLGLKYTVAKASKDWPVDTAVVLGIETTVVTVKSVLGSDGAGQSSMNLGCVFSKNMGMYIPYGAVAVKQYKINGGNQGAGLMDLTPATGLGFNLGCYIGIAKDQAIAVEYNTENIATKDVTKSGAVVADAYSYNVSGISLGYVYMF